MIKECTGGRRVERRGGRNNMMVGCVNGGGG